MTQMAALVFSPLGGYNCNHSVIPRMFMSPFEMSSFKSTLAILLASVCLGGQAASAQTNPLTYWTPGWPMGLGGTTTGQGANTYSNFPGFNYSDTGGDYATARYNFPNGWFVGTARGTMGFGMSSIGSSGAFGNLRYDGAQFGYNFQSTPVTVFGGVSSLKYDSGLGTALSSSFNNPNSSTVAGYSSNVGVEFRPASNLSLSFGAGFTQQGSGLVDSDIHSDLPPGASPLAFGHR
jgi:hypothetical protein